MKLVVATTQFPVSSDIPRNARYIRRQMNAAAKRGIPASLSMTCVPAVGRVFSVGSFLFVVWRV